VVAREIQERVDSEVHLPCSLGVATNKLVAKVANDFGKSQVKSGQAPRQITIVPPGEEAVFLAPLEVQALWGIGPKTSQKLHGQGIHTIGQLVALSIAELEAYFGNNALEMHARALGIDPSPVHAEREVKSVSNEVTFTKDTTDSEVLRQTLRALADKVGYRLRQAGLAGSVVQIKLRYSDFETLTRQTALPQPTNLDDEIYAAAEQLFEANIIPTRAVRLIGIGVSRLNPPYRQLSLWDDNQDEKEKLANAIDQLKEKYGQDVIKRASMMKAPKESDSSPNKS
jgi:DNA polymerase-4